MSKLRLLILDVETSPNVALVWSLFDQKRIPDEMLQEPGYTICAALKWLGEKKVQFRVIRRSASEPVDVAALKWIHGLMSEADGIITFNGDRFDIPTLNREFLEAGLKPPKPPQSIDLCKVVQRKFRFASTKMGYVAKRLGVALKAPSPGIACWIGCMAGEPGALRKMALYNQRDVVVTAAIYKKCLAWIDHHPNAALKWVGRSDNLIDDRPPCTNCGGVRVLSTGHYRRRGTMLHRAYSCVACGTPLRGKINLAAKKRGGK